MPNMIQYVSNAQGKEGIFRRDVIDIDLIKI